MSLKPWYPVKKKTVSKRLICPICMGYGTRNDARTGDKRICRGCNGIGRLKPNNK